MFPKLEPTLQRVDKTYTLSGYNLGESAKAVRFELHFINGLPAFDNLDYKVDWFPFSQIKSITKAKNTDPEGQREMDTLVVKEWILKVKELI